MVEKMSAIAQSGVLEHEWPELAVRTQRVCDSVSASSSQSACTILCIVSSGCLRPEGT